MKRSSITILALVLLAAAPSAAQVTYDTMHALCPQIERICGPTPSPRRTATPTTPSPRPTPTPTLSLAQLCPDGMLTAVASKTNANWFGFSSIHIATGELKKFCAPVKPPQVPAGLIPGSLTFSWYDNSDQDCSSLSVRVDAVSPPPRPRGADNFGSGFSSSGTLHYFSKVADKITPEQTAQGIYVMTVLGGPTPCGDSFKIAWNWTPPSTDLQCSPVGIRTLDKHESAVMCFTLPSGVLDEIVEVKATSTTGEPCGVVDMTVTLPSGRVLYASSSAPSISSLREPGRWIITALSRSGCTSFKFVATVGGLQVQ